jgi:hypothetical protein
MDSVIIVINLKPTEYDKTYNMGTTIWAGLVAEAAVYTTPPLALITFKSQLDTMKTHKDAWGVKGSHGSTESLTLLRADTLLIQDELDSYAKYCMITTPNDKPHFIAVGWKVKKVKAPIGPAGPITNFRQIDSVKVGTGQIYFRFTRPAGAVAFIIYHTEGSAITIPPDRTTFLACITQTFFLHKDLVPGSVHTYIIQPVSAVESDAYVGMTFHAKF